jgi:hypothetical protein
MDISVGRIVLYQLSDDDAVQINRRRTTGTSIAERIKEKLWPLGAQAHIGNTVSAGESYPMLVARVWSPGYVNGQVFLDGNDVFWATSVTEGEHGRMWAWPPRG